MNFEIIFKNIKDARTYYIHHVKTGKELSYTEMFRYIYFIEDVVILNIYLLLGIDIKLYKGLTYNNYLYKIDDLK